MLLRKITMTRNGIYGLSNLRPNLVEKKVIVGQKTIQVSLEIDRISNPQPTLAFLATDGWYIKLDDK